MKTIKIIETLPSSTEKGYYTIGIFVEGIVERWMLKSGAFQMPTSEKDAKAYIKRFTKWETAMAKAQIQADTYGLPLDGLGIINPKKYPATSIYVGETWLAYRPGEDNRFKNNWVLRDITGNASAVVNSRIELMDCARRCKVKTRWAFKPDEPEAPEPDPAQTAAERIYALAEEILDKNLVKSKEQTISNFKHIILQELCR